MVCDLAESIHDFLGCCKSGRISGLRVNCLGWLADLPWFAIGKGGD